MRKVKFKCYKGKLHFAGAYSRVFSRVYAHAPEGRFSAEQPCCSLEGTLVAPLCLHSGIVLERLATKSNTLHLELQWPLHNASKEGSSAFWGSYLSHDTSAT